MPEVPVGNAIAAPDATLIVDAAGLSCWERIVALLPATVTVSTVVALADPRRVLATTVMQRSAASVPRFLQSEGIRVRVSRIRGR